MRSPLSSLPILLLAFLSSISSAYPQPTSPPPYTHFGTVIPGDLASDGSCGLSLALLRPSENTRGWISLSSAYGPHYCGKEIEFMSDDRTVQLTVVDVEFCLEDHVRSGGQKEAAEGEQVKEAKLCGAEDAMVSDEMFEYLYEDDLRVKRQAAYRAGKKTPRKFAPRWRVVDGA